MRRGKQYQGKHSVLLPHELFATLYAGSQELFDRIFCGELGNLEKYWEGAARAGGSWFDLHPVVESQPNAALRIPIGIHGDDAGAFHNRKFLVLTWGSVAVELPTMDSRLLFAILDLDECVHDDADTTMQTVYKIFTWSLNALATGLHPYNDWNNVPFSDDYRHDMFEKRGLSLTTAGYVGAWSELRGDWKFLTEALYLVEHYGCSHQMCHLCRASASISRLSMENYSPQSRHRRTLTEPLPWWRRYTSAVLVSPLLFLIGFNIWKVVFDIMHCLDLGLLQPAVASSMWELVEDDSVFRGLCFSKTRKT